MPHPSRSPLAQITRIALACSLAGTAMAQSYHEPARGSAERKELMAAVRPFAESVLGAPVEFVVRDLRVAGDVGYAALDAQRPGGGRIDLATTPHSRRYGHDPNLYPGIYALYQKQNGHWRLTGSDFSPFEPPFMSPQECAVYGAVLVEWC